MTVSSRRASKLRAAAGQEAAALLAAAGQEAAALVAAAEEQAAELLAVAERQAGKLVAAAERQAAGLLAAAKQQAAGLLAAAKQQAAERLAAAKQKAAEQQAAELLAAAEQPAAELVAAAEEQAAELLAAAEQPAAELLAGAKGQAAELLAAAKRQAAERVAAAKQQAAGLVAAAEQETAKRMAALRQSEDEVLEAQKMAALGQLAGGIAHDFNNLLTVISGYTEILLVREAEGSKELVEISKAAERATELTHQLLAYSRKQVLMPRALDLNDVVTETQGMLERLIGENLEFSIALAEDLGCISADPGQVEQIIVNLVLNARDAMPEGGTLRLETAKLTLAEASGPADMPPGDYAVLALTDSGQGMDAETIERIFEPFYTSKERGVGTGLGLATVYGIVMQSGGHIEVESEPGIGTCFRLYFPQVAQEAEAVLPKPPDQRRLTGSETVLLVEDEEGLRELERRMLEMYGYTVLLAPDGQAGLELAQNHPDPIQVLMTDIMMPQMGGIELAERLSSLRPELKVLYTSGYYDHKDSWQMIAGSRYIQKPFTIAELAHTLRELLDSVHVSGAPPRHA